MAKSKGVRFSVFFQPVMRLNKPLEYYETEHDGTSMARPEFAETFRTQYLEGESGGLKQTLFPFTSLKKVFEAEKAPISAMDCTTIPRGTKRSPNRSTAPRSRRRSRDPLSPRPPRSESITGR